MLSLEDPVGGKIPREKSLIQSGISKEELFEVDLLGNFLQVQLAGHSRCLERSPGNRTTAEP